MVKLSDVSLGANPSNCSQKELCSKVRLKSLSLGVFLLPELSELSIVSRSHGGLSGSPGSGANLTVLIGVLESFNKTEGLVDITSDGEVVHGDVAENTLIVDDVGGAEGDSGIGALFNEAAVVAGNLVC